MRPFDRGNGVLVVLHGHGDDPASARDWGRQIAPPSWEVVAPGAPVDREGVRSWFATGPRGADEGAVVDSLTRVQHVIDGITAQGRPVAVAGFSQGGALALELARSDSGARAVIAFNAFLVERDEVLAGEAPSVAGRPSDPGRPPVLVLGAVDDEIVPAFLGQDAAAVLASQEFLVVSEVLAGDHRVSRAMESRAAAWLRDKVVSGIRVSIGLPVDRVDTGAELVSGTAVSDLAAGFERAGFHATYVTDHPAPDERWLADGGHHALEPTVALTMAAASTRSLLLHTNVYVLGYRNPFLAAKALASLDVLSGGRLILGVAAGYLRPEFAAVGTGFDDRTGRLDEALELLPRIWSEHGVAVRGTGFEARGVTSLPRPLQRPHPPIWIGGNSTSAMRRAVRFAQGWSPFPTPDGLERAARTAAISTIDELEARLRLLDELREADGRADRLTVCFSPLSMNGYLADPDRGMGPMVDEIEALAGLGVDWVTVSVPGLARNEVLDRAAALAAALRLD